MMQEKLFSSSLLFDGVVVTETEELEIIGRGIATALETVMFQMFDKEAGPGLM